MFEWVGKTIAGGWDAVSNVAATIGKGASTLVSGFFPTPQRTTIKSDIVEPAGILGQTFRVTDPDTPSLYETAEWAEQGWLGSPYEAQYAIPSMTQESYDLASKVTAGTPNAFDKGLADILAGAEVVAGKAEKVITLADQLGALWGRVSTVFSGPKEIGSSPGTIINVQPRPTTGAATSPEIPSWLSSIVTGASNILSQAKGLFNLGYGSPEGPQPAFSIRHELQPTKATTIGLVAAAIVILILVLLLRKK